MKKRKIDNVNINIKSDAKPSSYRRYRRRYPYAKYARELRDIIGPRGSDNSIYNYGSDRASASPAQLALRKAARFYGKGPYSMNDVAKYGIRGAGAIAAGLAALPSRDPLTVFNSGKAGWNAGARLSKWAGFGDYAPVATNSIMGDADNNMMNSQQNISVNSISDEGDVIISFTEFVQNVVVTNSSGAGAVTPFSVQSFSLNPGLQGVFPWLSQVANNFTLYEFEGLMFQYKPTSGEYGSANANTLGKIIMATNYDPSAAVFINSQGMENYDYAVACKPSCGAVHAVETDVKQRFSNQLYVRSGNVTKDKVLTDLGLFQVATEGVYCGSNGTFIVGELWVTYKVKLSRKYLGDQIGNTIDYDSWNTTTGSAGWAIVNGSNIYGSVTQATGLTYQFPQNVVGGTFIVIMAVQSATSLASNTPIFSTSSGQNCTIKAIGPTGLTPQYPVSLNNASVGPTVKTAAWFAMVKITAPGTLIASVSVTCTTDGFTNGTLFVQQIAQSMFDNDPQ